MKDLIIWINKRIDKTIIERKNSLNLFIKISKGAKLTVYREMLEYVKTHYECNPTT